MIRVVGVLTAKPGTPGGVSRAFQGKRPRRAERSGLPRYAPVIDAEGAGPTRRNMGPIPLSRWRPGKTSPRWRRIAPRRTCWNSARRPRPDRRPQDLRPLAGVSRPEPARPKSLTINAWIFPMTHLFSEWKLRGVTLPDRIGVSPMCQYSCEDGFANDWHFAHLPACGRRRGAGLYGSCRCVRRRAIRRGSRRLEREHFEPLERIARFIDGQGAVAGHQLADAGRKASTFGLFLQRRGG